MLHKFIVYHIVLILLATGALILTQKTDCVTSFLLGSFVFLFNFILMALAWLLIFHKKFIALAIALIVLKYAILGYSVYWSMHSTWVHAGWFIVGIASFTLSALLVALRVRKNVI